MGRKASSPGERAVRDALLIREFLDGCPSQLTVHGLASLVEGLEGGQLAVFFRNNHFNVMYKQGGSLYLLVTDQGYLYEPEVVWERLDNVGGDTQLLGWDLKPFVPHAPAQQLTTDDEGLAALTAAEWEADGGGGGRTDADFALAMQLQQEEEERVRREEQRRREAVERQRQAQRAQQQQQQQQGVSGRPPRPEAAPGGGWRQPARKEVVGQDQRLLCHVMRTELIGLLYVVVSNVSNVMTRFCRKNSIRSIYIHTYQYQLV